MQWTRNQYHRLAELAFFEGRRVELIEGQVIDRAAMKSPHAVAIDLVDAALKALFGSAMLTRHQWHYAEVSTYQSGQSIASLNAQRVEIAVP